MSNTPRYVSSPERVFCLIAAVFGVCLLLVTPPNQVPDEGHHYLRAFQITRGQFVATKIGNRTGGEIPSGVNAFFAAFPHVTSPPISKNADPISYYQDAVRRYRLATGGEAFTPFSGAAVHSPIPYLPQVCGILLARAVTDSVAVTFYVARIVNLFCYIVLAAFAIRLTPIMKWLFVLLLLTPIAMYVAASVSPDALTNALGYLMCAQLFRLAFGYGEQLTRGRLLALVSTAVVLGLSKQAYYPLVLAFLLVPVGRAGSRRRYWLIIALLLLVTLVAVGGWGAVVARTYSPPDVQSNPVGQLQFIRENPFTVGRYVLNDLVDSLHFMQLLWQFVGVLGLIDTPLPLIVVALHWAVLLLVAAGDRSAEISRISRWQKAVASGVAGLTVLLIFVTQYVTWTPVGSEKIWGIQGRYFIPLGPVLFLPLYGLCSFSPASDGVPRLPRFVWWYTSALLALTVFLLWKRFYDS